MELRPRDIVLIAATLLGLGGGGYATISDGARVDTRADAYDKALRAVLEHCHGD